ncbi:phage tail sheath family protein [Nostoc sp. FACHB-152]|uniref:phage tail sheath family protein n=1 Tax=unclassified Nostoc TaxID=2593658 RepID=UPI0016827D79|nr:MULTISPECIES: phage tail sheath subtilisin-like domain-containing protein [unclassified Nostoc]MBD2449059.1 phage tail sheath family protein [Nostoc sp. FACHB-152]MBD2471037.1 phage tail sheath family protein [Nostoc sp. FACHB-145]
MPTLEPKIPGVSLNYVVPTPEAELLTGVPVFFGLTTLKTDINEAKRLTLATHFQQYFEQTTGYLADAIAGFFENGGRLCYVIALADNTLDALQAGLEASEILENVDLVCVPDIMLNSDGEVIKMQQTILEHCERMGDRFAILDALNSGDLIVLNQQRLKLASRNGALYAPWLKVENRSVDIPPCGHIAGIYASCDRAVGVHGAPANIPLAGVLDISFSLTATEQEQLNPIASGGVNCIRSFPARGMRVWGVRTLSPILEWQYVNVRRLFLTFGRWANRNLANTVFEPNTFPLWVRLQRELSVYCESLWRQGALQGGLPQEAFYVKCDAETNPPENREIGQVVAEVGLAPTIPGEFIQLLLVQSSTGISVV